MQSIDYDNEQCETCKTKQSRYQAYVRALRLEQLAALIRGKMEVPDEFLCHGEDASIRRVREYALFYAIDKWRYPCIRNYKRKDIPLTFQTAMDEYGQPIVDMSAFIVFIEAVFELRNGKLVAKDNTPLTYNADGHFRTSALHTIPYYFNQCMNESLTNRVNVAAAVAQMKMSSKMLLSTIMISELLGMADLSGDVPRMSTAPGYSLTNMGFVTSDMPDGLFDAEVKEQARRYGVLLYYVKPVTYIPTKFFLTEEVPVRDNETYKSLLLRRRGAQKMEVTREVEGFKASVKVDGDVFVSTVVPSIKEAEEEVSKKVLMVKEGPEPAIQLYRRRLAAGTIELVNVTHEATISSRYKMGFTAEIPREDWNNVSVGIIPIDKNGDYLPDKCGVNKHVATHSVKLLFGKPNNYVPTKYAIGVTGIMSFDGCMGPHCSRKEPQAYALAINAGNFRWRSMFCVSHHQDSRSRLGGGTLEYFKEVEQAIKRRRDGGVIKPKAGPIAAVVQKVDGKLLRMSAADSAESQDAKANDMLRDSEEAERRRPKGKWEVRESRRIPGMNSPAKITVSAVNNDEFLNYLSLYCLKSYALFNGGQVMEVGYTSIIDAMCDYARLGEGYFPVIDVKMITTTELLGIASKGCLISHTHDPPPLINKVVEGNGNKPMHVEKMCVCVGSCSETCLLHL